MSEQLRQTQELATIREAELEAAEGSDDTLLVEAERTGPDHASAFVYAGGLVRQYELEQHEGDWYIRDAQPAGNPGSP